jgi:VWFA-related protein
MDCMTPFLRSAIALVLSIAALGAHAQQRLGETIEVSIVSIDVHVTDRKGNRVTGLGPDDFEIREDGRPQPITNFSEYVPAESAASVEPAPEGAAARREVVPAEPRTIVLFMEPVRLPNFRATQFFDSIRELLGKTVRPGDRVAVATWANSMSIRLPLTDDMGKITSTLAAVEREYLRAQPVTATLIRETQEAADRNIQLFGEAIGRSPASSRPGVPLNTLMAAKQQLSEIRQKARAVESLMLSISGFEGRKIVIMATERFGRYAGAEFFSSGMVPMEDQQMLSTVTYRESMIRTANANGITIYPLEPEGMQTTTKDASSGGTGQGDPGFDSQVLMNETSALQEVATDTGGLLAWSSVDIAAMLPRVADDLESYYSLGYRARTARKDLTRAIVVKAKNPDYVVRARRQFVEKSDTTRMQDRVVANLSLPVEGSVIPFDAVVGAFTRTGKKQWTAPLTIRIPIAKLMTLRDGKGEAGTFSVFVVTGADFGTISDVEHRTQPFTIPTADLQRARASYFKYAFTLKLDSVADRVSVGVMDETSKEFGLRRIAIPPR